MADILLAHAYALADDPIEQRIMKPYIPMGILSIATYLRQRGIDAHVFDATFSAPGDFTASLKSFRPPVVGIYVNMMTKFSALRMIREAKAQGAMVILGGPEPPFYAAEFLKAGADAIVVGEGEETVAELLERIDTGSRDLSGIPGVVFADPQEGLKRNAARPHIPDLDKLPMPDRSLANMHRYLDAWRRAHGSTSLSMITMRGCPYTCTWCSHAVYGNSYRRRSPRLVAEELQCLTATYHPDAFWFADDVFTINHPWIFELERELRQRQLSIRYECIARADRLNEDVVRALRTSGCTRIWIGSESGSQRILDAMSRRVKAEQVQAMTALAHRFGIDVGMFIMFGYTGETPEDVEQTVRHVKISRPDTVLTTVAYPIKGTAFYHEVEDRLVLPSLPFEEWNDRMIDIRGRLSRRFYWFAHRRVINEAAVSRLANAIPTRPAISMVVPFLKAQGARLGMYLTR